MENVSREEVSAVIVLNEMGDALIELTAAELFQMPGDIGEVVAGARADLIALDGDPLADIEILQDPDRYLKFVCKEGEIYKNAL